MASKNTSYKNSEVKARINDRLETVVIETGKLSQAVNKSSKSREILHQCTKSFTALDSTITNTDQSLKLMEGTLLKLDVQSEKFDEKMNKINPLVESIQRINNTKTKKT